MVGDLIPYEIHITGENTIISELNNLGVKNIIVQLLKPDGELLRTEYMSSHVIKRATYAEVLEFIDDLTSKLESKIIRVKIECPPYKDLFEHSLYIESHFKPKRLWGNIYPVSRNSKSGKLMATDREYDISGYDLFLEKWADEDCELCLFDTFKEEDLDWFELYDVNLCINK